MLIPYIITKTYTYKGLIEANDRQDAHDILSDRIDDFNDGDLHTDITVGGIDD